MPAILHPLDDIIIGLISVAGSLAAIVASFSYAYSIIKNNKSKADSDTIETYKSEVDALKLRLDRIESENKDLTKKVTALQSERDTYKQIVNNQDPKFREDFLKMATCVAQMSQDFRTHYKDDEKKFTQIIKLLQKK